MTTKPKCPECGSSKVWKIGVWPTRKGPKQRWKCVKCARGFYGKIMRKKKAG